MSFIVNYFKVGIYFVSLSLRVHLLIMKGYERFSHFYGFLL